MESVAKLADEIDIKNEKIEWSANVKVYQKIKIHQSTLKTKMLKWTKVVHFVRGLHLASVTWMETHKMQDQISKFSFTSTNDGKIVGQEWNMNQQLLKEK